MFRNIAQSVRVVLFMLVMMSFAFIVACTSGPAKTGDSPAQQLTPQQVVAIACPPLEASLVQLQIIYASQADMGSPTAAKASEGIAKAQPIIAQACAVGAAVSVADVQSFITTALPSLAKVAGTLPLTPKQQADVQTALLTAQVALGVYDVVQSQMAVKNVAPAVASSTPEPAPASSAPAK